MYNYICKAIPCRILKVLYPGEKTPVDHEP